MLIQGQTLCRIIGDKSKHHGTMRWNGDGHGPPTGDLRDPLTIKEHRTEIRRKDAGQILNRSGCTMSITGFRWFWGLPMVLWVHASQRSIVMLYDLFWAQKVSSFVLDLILADLALDAAHPTCRAVSP